MDASKGLFYKIRHFPVFGAEKITPVQSSLIHVLPDGRSVVDANQLLRDPKVISLLKSLHRRIEATREVPETARIADDE
jgi:hypothetical protein